MRVFVYDTTLRDGTQGENVAFSVADKLAIARRLDEIGIDYIEGGWPGSNPRDAGFFDRAKAELRLRRARLVAFGSTRHAANPVGEDPNVRKLVEAETPVVAVFGKSWNLHTERALRVTEQQNLEMIGSTVAHLKSLGREVIYDAEHFFDGYRSSRDFAFRTLDAALSAGADCLVLCDTNGGTLTAHLSEIVADVREHFGGVIGIHTHNDCELAVANAIAAVELGATHVQGTMNGYGERCGNCNLISTICNLELKLGHTVVGRENVARLTAFANYVADMANLRLANGSAFVARAHSPTRAASTSAPCSGTRSPTSMSSPRRWATCAASWSATCPAAATSRSSSRRRVGTTTSRPRRASSCWTASSTWSSRVTSWSPPMAHSSSSSARRWLSRRISSGCGR